MPERIDRQAEFSGTRPVAQALRIDAARLERYLKDAVPGFAGPVSIAQFRGGQSNPTYAIEAASGRYVLRRKPPGALLPSAHAVDREYRVMKALGEVGFPVPRVHALCVDESVIGTMFYVMDLVEGRVVWEPHMPDAGREEREAVFASLNDTIARLHGFSVAALGLEDFGRPANYVARQIARWSRQYRETRYEDVPDMDRLMDWLPGNLPPEGRPSLVHGDFRLDNTILDPHEPRIVAVLDWELSTLGDPVADFTYHIMQWRMPPSPTGAGVGSLVGHDLEALGIPALEDYVARYEAATGASVTPHLDFYFAYNFFRLAAIFQGIGARARAGTAANPAAEAMAEQLRPLSRVAWDYAVAAGAG